MRKLIGKSIKNNKIGCILLLSICIAGATYMMLHRGINESMQKDIAKEVIRFHVIANSDNAVDQNVKLMVKDNVVSYMQGKLNGVETREQAEHIMKKEMPVIREIAQRTVEEEGYQYPCDVVYHEREFPIKVYGDLTFPAGKYEALDVLLGNAEGKNWWCVMFPSLCFVDGSYCVVPDSSKAKLKNVLTKEEYKSISTKKTCKVSYKFKLFGWIKKRNGNEHKR